MKVETDWYFDLDTYVETCIKSGLNDEGFKVEDWAYRLQGEPVYFFGDSDVGKCGEFLVNKLWCVYKGGK